MLGIVAAICSNTLQIYRLGLIKGRFAATTFDLSSTSLQSIIYTLIFFFLFSCLLILQNLTAKDIAAAYYPNRFSFDLQGCNDARTKGVQIKQIKQMTWLTPLPPNSWYALYQIKQ